MSLEKIQTKLKKLDKNNYSVKTWNEKYKNGNKKVKLIKLIKNKKWKKVFKKEPFKSDLKKLDKFFNELFERNKGKKINIFPYPEFIFSAFNALDPEDVLVVIQGQDPYHGFDMVKIKNDNKKNSDLMVPQAMGLSFSVPYGIDANSLDNIFKNQINFKVIKEKPNHGNLYGWAEQGVLLLNMSLTADKGSAGGYMKNWKQFTDNVISYISKNLQNVVFLVWGAPSLEKVTNGLIDQKKHKVIISSHPSGLSANKPLKNYLPFMKTDHFGECNKYLKKHDKKEIAWKLKNKSK